MRLNKLSEAQLIRYWRVAVKLLNKYQTERAFIRLGRIVDALDRRGI